jgi:hypothetical protein
MSGAREKLHTSRFTNQSQKSCGRDMSKVQQQIGVRPENGDKLKWSCIDIDPANYKEYTSKKYVDIIRDFELPLVPVKSKSGGLHLFIFLQIGLINKKLKIS